MVYVVLYSYGLHSYGLYSYGLYSYGLYGHGLYNHGLYSYGLTGLCPYIVMALYSYGLIQLWPYTVMALYSYGLYSYGRDRRLLGLECRLDNLDLLRHRREHILLGTSAFVYISRSMPTANAEVPCRPEGT